MRAWRGVVGTTLLMLAACARPQGETEPGATASTQSAAAPTPAFTGAASPSTSAAAGPQIVPTVTPSPTLPARDLREPSYPPRNDCGEKPGWAEFRAALARAVEHRDAQGLAALATPDVTLDYGGGNGTAELKRRLAAPNAALWTDLARILTLGCAVQGQLTAMPWYFWNLPDSTDPGMAMIGLGDGIALLDRPAPDAHVVARLGWPVVTIASPPGFDPKARYTRVTTQGAGTKGYIATRELRSLLARRLIAERKGGAWKISALVSGD